VSSSQPPGGSPRPEYLEQHGGSPLGDREPRSGGRGGPRVAVLAVVGALGLGLVGLGAWSAMSFLGTGSQPAEALPGSTLGYVSIDLDPSGSQKIEAIRTLRKFPAFREQVGLQTDDDVRRKIFDEIQKEAHCAGLDYADDIEPWLGDRAAVAAVETGGQTPAPVVVVQVTDDGKAEEGLATLASCATNDSPGAGWAISNGWAVLAETDKVAERVIADADAAPLSEDADFKRWSDEVGDPGIVTMYAAPEAGAYLAQNLDRMGSLGAQGAAMTPTGDRSEALKDFRGAAGTVRFKDGALELELAADAAATGKSAYAGNHGDDVLATLPADTAAALGVGFSEGWFTDVAEQLASYSGGEMSTEQFLSMLSEQSGLDLPADAETLAGESMAVAVGSDLDPETLVNSSDGSDVPVAAKVKGDVDAIEAVLDKVRGTMGGAPTPIDSDSRGDVVAVGPNPEYRRSVLGDGGLGRSEAFRRVVPNASEASVVFFLNFDAGDNWLAKLASGDPQAADNLEPLQGLGISAWQQGDAGHALVRLTTN
jgi:hypothetical protein